MADIRILSAQDISRVFTIADALEAVEDAYRQKANGTGIAWPMVYAAFEPDVADMDIRSGELAGSSLFGLKLTAWFSKNPEQDLPEVFGTTLICDDTTGAPSHCSMPAPSRACAPALRRHSASSGWPARTPVA